MNDLLELRMLQITDFAEFKGDYKMERKMGK